MEVVKEVQYDSAFTFIYSKRTGTPAAVMENQIPDDVVKDRFDRLLAEVQEISRERCARDRRWMFWWKMSMTMIRPLSPED